ncbi:MULTISPECIES: DUF4267 domain-containing protein [Streptomyces]|uniref:DUF4267 domain-containing protein n=1 Tax=Streptomyces virginiae TaxID=1961 RepID=A0ABZ1T2P7_STRVG|nr:DUF4267 domain-containing protein [Streptomyces virginiae]
MKSIDVNRVLGAATALYSVAIMVRPEWLAKPCDLPLESDGRPPRQAGLLIRAIGARDTAIGVAMTVASSESARRSAAWCRVATDTADAALFGTLLESKQARWKVAGFALSWAALCALSLRSIRS